MTGRVPPRRVRAGAVLAVSIACLAAAGPTATAAPPPEATAAASVRAQIDRAVRQAIAQDDLRAVILQVTVGGRRLMTKAYGESMAGVPATTDMHFRNGAVAISYMSTLLLRLVDQGESASTTPSPSGCRTCARAEG